MDERILKAREKIKEKMKEQGYVISKKEALVMVCDTVEQVEKIYKYEVLEEKMEEGTLDKEDLMGLCEDVFGKDDQMGRLVYLSFVKNKKIDATLTKEEEQEYNNLSNKVKR